MGATADTIWQVPVYLPYLQPPLTDAAVAAAEKQIGHKLPAEYLNLLRTQNGGYIRFSLPEMVHDRIAGIGPRFPSLTQFDWEECQNHVSFSLRGLVPFDGDGHWHLCLDYRGRKRTPVVTYVDIECDREAPVADSFAGYLALLQREVGDGFVVDGADLERIKAALESQLGLTFEPPDDWAYGYQVHRAGLTTKGGPEWVWVSPNTVPRGFVRPNEPRYAEMKALLPGTAPRWPELPAESFILTATDGIRSRVVRACAKARLAIRPLREYMTGG